MSLRVDDVHHSDNETDEEDSKQNPEYNDCVPTLIANISGTAQEI